MLDRTRRQSSTPAPRRLRASFYAAAIIGLLLGGGCGESPPPQPEKPEPPVKVAPVPATVAPVVAEAKKPEEPGITMQQLLDVHRATSPQALDGTRFLYLSDAPGTAQIFASAEGDRNAVPKQLTSYPDRVSSLRVLPDRKRALFMKDSGGDENYQIFLLDLDGSSEAIALTNTPKVRHTPPSFDEAGTRIAYTSNARNGKDMDLYVDPLPTGGAGGAKADAKQAPLVELAGSHSVQDFRGDKILVLEERGSFDKDIWIIDAKTKKKTLLTKHTGEERYDWAHFSHDGRVVFTLTDAGREYMSLVAIDPANRKRTPIIELDHDVVKAALPPPNAAVKYVKTESDMVPGAEEVGPKVKDVIVYAVNKAGTEELLTVWLDASRKVIKRSSGRLFGVIGSLDVAPGGTIAFVGVEGSRMPSEVFGVALSTGMPAPMTRSDHAGIDTSKLVQAELLSLPTFDKKTISLFWYKAPSAKSEKLPVMIMIHGGPEGQWQPGWNALAQYFALNGYAVAAPNVRGSSGYGKTFGHLDDKEKREDSVKDLSEVGKFLAARPDVDGSKLVLFGGSYGGYMVLAGMTLFPEQWAAGIDVVGIANFRTFLEQTAPYRRALREAEYGSLATDGALLDRISPIHAVDRIRAPLMVIHGTRDPRVPIGEARQVAEALKKRGLPVELMTFEDEGHGLAKRKNRLVAYPAAVAFLDKYVKNRKP